MSAKPKDKRLVPFDDLEPFYQGVDEFCEAHLAGADEITHRAHSRKIIADPVGGYCSLEGWEVAIVDTPLFQRLRSIRQLGLTYLVYPTLGYSRFEHVIGVRARLEHIIATIKENMLLRPEPYPNLPTDSQLTKMRLAVLCHDIGHCLFSHVSESVISALTGGRNYPSAGLILNKFQEYVGRNVPISEILSVAILTSPVFVEYLNKIGMTHPTISTPAQKVAHDAAHLILGLPIPNEPQSLFLAQLMNSGLDIDKLDYMMRESLLSGISLGISLDWLLKKLFIASLPAGNVPAGLCSRLRSQPVDQPLSTLALERGGQFAFEEFCVARLTLHEKVYLHQKTRAAEAHIRTLLTRIASQISAYREVHRWLYLKESMLQYPEVELPALPDTDLFNAKEPRTAADLGFDRISKRMLLSRAYAFGWQNSIGDPIYRDGVDRGELGVDKLMDVAVTRPAALEAAIRECLKEILVRLGDDDVKADKVTILIDPPRTSSIQQGQDSIYIEHPVQLSLRWTMPIDRIEDYYHRNRALGYIFSDYDSLPFVMLAAECAAWKLCGVVCIQDGLVNSNILDSAQEHRLELDRSGFYDNARALRPMSDYLRSANAQLMITSLAERLAWLDPHQRVRVSPASITAYVSQFPTELHSAALSWLDHIKFIRPDEKIRTLLDGYAAEHFPAQWKNIGFCALGSTTDSANHMSYSLRDVQRMFPAGVRSFGLPLAEALAQLLDAYIIYDDNTNTGLQALNIMASWLGRPLPDEYQLEEDHVLPLPDRLRNELLSKPIVLAFAVSIAGSTARLEKLLCEHLGFRPELLKCISSVELPENRKVFSGADSPFQHSRKTELREFVRDVGKSIFMSEGKTEAAAEARCMGAQHAEAMVILPYNVPTMTIAALWAKGMFAGKQWIPLVERRRRTNRITGKLAGEDA